MKAVEARALGETGAAARDSLVAAPLATDRDAVYVGLVSRYYEAMLRYIHGLVGTSQQAEDLVQDTFLRAYLALPQVGMPENPRAWLYRIATNVTLDHLRRRRKLTLVGLDRLMHVLAGRDGIHEVEERQPVNAALAALKPEDRAILMLFADAGLKAPEVARVLGISPVAARKRRQRAREAFTEAYKEASREV